METSKEILSTESKQLTVTEKKTLPQLETEIKEHLTKIATNYIEVGNRLIEAKELVKHGQWQIWLENNFQLKRQSAQNFMNIAKRFGTKYQSIGNLNSTQMIAMLSLPEGQEERFIEQKTIDGIPIEKMSIKSLKTEIKQWNSTHKKPKKKKTSANKSTIDIDATISSKKSNPNLTNSEQQDIEIRDNETTDTSTTSIDKGTQDDNNNYFLLERFFCLSNDLANISNLNEVAQKYFEDNPDKFDSEMKNLNFIINAISYEK